MIPAKNSSDYTLILFAVHSRLQKRKISILKREFQNILSMSTKNKTKLNPHEHCGRKEKKRLKSSRLILPHNLFFFSLNDKFLADKSFLIFSNTCYECQSL